MNLFLIFAFLFAIGSTAGWCIEVLYRRFLSKNNPGKKWINPGFLTGPCLPIYGFGLATMYFTALLGRLPMTGSKAGDVAIVLVLIAVLMTLIELAAGLFFRNTYNVMLWDYRNERFNYKGVICPKFSLIWGISGCIYFFSINDHVARWVDWLSWHLTFSFVIGFFFGVFAIDVAYSFNLAGRLRSFAKENEIEIRYEELKLHLAEQREELEERARFLLPFRSERRLSDILEDYQQWFDAKIEEKKLAIEEKKSAIESKLKR